MLTGAAVVFGYALLGSTWLIMKTDGALQKIVFALTRPLVAVVVAFMGLVSAWLPFLSSQHHGALVLERELAVAVAGAAAGAGERRGVVAIGDASRRAGSVRVRTERSSCWASSGSCSACGRTWYHRI